MHHFQMQVSKNVMILLLVLFGLAVCAPEGKAQSDPRWKAHDTTRPLPRVVTPATPATPVAPPSDAIVLFDGTNLLNWCGKDGGPAPWSIQDGAMIPVGTGHDIYTKQPFGDVQLRIEWSAPVPVQGNGQGRGNSGVFLMGLYEIQVLDSYENVTYADGQAAALYGQYPPLVNACLPPGQWQTYDIVFRRPRFHPDGTLAKPARMTAFHNGVVVQDAAELWGPTMWLQYIPYKVHPDKLPISLQDHGNPLRFRNIWVRELRESTEPGPAYREQEPVIHMTEAALARYVGMYKSSPDSRSGFEVTSDGQQLHCLFGEPQTMVDLVPHSATKFSLRWTAAHVEFQLEETGPAKAMTLHVPGAVFTVKRFE